MGKKWYLVMIISTLFILGCSSVEEQFYPNGKLKYRINLINEYWDGLYQEFYQSGALKIEQNYVRGTINGSSKFYFESGNLMKIDTFKMGLINGISIEYFDNGQTLRIGRWSEDVPIGIHRFYTKEGNLLETDYYDSDGRPYDYQKYNERGELIRNSKVALIFAKKDTVNFGSKISLTGFLTNNEYNVRMIVGLNYDSINNVVLDTLEVIVPTSYDDGNEFSYRPEKAGEFILYGVLQDKVIISDEYIEILSVPFSYKFFIKDN